MIELRAQGQQPAAPAVAAVAQQVSGPGGANPAAVAPAQPQPLQVAAGVEPPVLPIAPEGSLAALEGIFRTFKEAMASPGGAVTPKNQSTGGALPSARIVPPVWQRSRPVSRLGQLIRALLSQLKVGTLHVIRYQRLWLRTSMMSVRFLAFRPWTLLW